MNAIIQQLIDRMASIEAKLDMLIVALADEATDDPLLHEAGLYPERDQSQPL